MAECTRDELGSGRYRSTPPLVAEDYMILHKQDEAPFQTVNPMVVPDWDVRLAEIPAAGIFHSRAWAGILQATYGFGPRYLLDETGSKLNLMLPVMEVNSPLTGRRGISLPFTDECAVLGDSKRRFQEAFQHLIRQGKERKWNYIELRGNEAPAPEASPSLSFYTHSLELSPDIKALFMNLKSNVRRNLATAERSELTLHIHSDSTSMLTYYHLHCVTRERHGLPPQPYRFFRQIQEKLLDPGNGIVVLAKSRELPVAGAVFLFSREEGIYKFGASREDFQQLRPNNLVMWAGIRWLAERGIKRFSMGRTSLMHDGLRRFKQSWGTAEKRLDYYRFDLRSDRYASDKDRVEGWYNKVFRAMPLPLARWIGGGLYRHIA